ncbi:LOW QUALITY PROTEIN: hypothetical protein PoB_002351100 [Plakobranchus ocellatus]|uniref:Uncharacterized protein n=1 Tax=Plakobranchus ocellatus TaxID=259542 RepID=A0AAV3ZM18_9GAST|nr:LOW QUALITY PROTEIN: hypothetical protein PoB_002351100 [Plakobranchus ocellatus]
MQDIGARLKKQTYVYHRFGPQGCCTLRPSSIFSTMLKNVYMSHTGLIMILIDDVRIHLAGKERTLSAAAFRLWTTLCRTASIRLRQYPPPGTSKSSAPVRNRQYPPPGISKASAPVRLRQYPPPGIPKASAPVRHRQYPQGYQKPMLQSAFANTPHQGYQKPMLQSVIAKIPH